jgi:1-deoxy-D-xylulose-5-phosphate reductoisomerase
MKKKIIILGSTGSIGTTLIDIIKKNQNKFEVKLLTANKNTKLLLKQAKLLKVKNIIITNDKEFKKVTFKNKNKELKIFNNFNFLDKILNSKVDYTMSSISGLAGLEPTLKIIKHTKTIAIANKEAIICGWDLINGKIKKYKTNFIPVDSEHFSIWYALKNNFDKIEKIYLTASGGPFNKMPVKKFKNINIKQALKHPNWKMGKKISIDSATMMNKVFEIIEAKNIFNVSYKKLSILIHPKSYIHAIVKFNNGMTKIIAHDTSMKIPILNSLNLNSDGLIKSKKLNLMILNNLDFQNVDKNKFPVVNILKEVPKSSSLFETLIVSANDEFVELFLNKRIQFVDIYKKLSKLISLNEFQQYKKIKVKKLNSIIQLDKYVRLKIKSDYKTI